jgi:glyoxylase-like metal-dependent hydrolase (beta-lactamase superfamily II)
MLICATCAVERDEPTPGVCPICTDERQYVPEDGQKWLTLDGLAQEGQVEWSHRLGGVPVLVADADRRWLGRKDPIIEYWSGSRTIAEGLTLHQTGGHFPGSAVVHWAAGAGGKGVLLTGDSVYPNPDRRSIAFMRSYPNHVPLSGAVAVRIAAQLGELKFDRIYGNFNNVIASGAKAILHDSAQRHAAWARGDFDHLT